MNTATQNTVATFANLYRNEQSRALASLHTASCRLNRDTAEQAIAADPEEMRAFMDGVGLGSVWFVSDCSLDDSQEAQAATVHARILDCVVDILTSGDDPIGVADCARDWIVAAAANGLGIKLRIK
jgi:hypothetical protein